MGDSFLWAVEAHQVESEHEASGEQIRTVLHDEGHGIHGFAIAPCLVIHNAEIAHRLGRAGPESQCSLKFLNGRSKVAASAEFAGFAEEILVRRVRRGLAIGGSAHEREYGETHVHQS